MVETQGFEVEIRTLNEEDYVKEEISLRVGLPLDTFTPIHDIEVMHY